MRRKLSITSLLLAWLCANGALWNVVQVVGWVKMLHDYSQVMPAAQAWQITFDGTAPCNLCHLSQAAQDAARNQLPREAALGAGLEKLVLISEGVPAIVVTAPDPTWRAVTHDTGLTRTEPVPVPPPRNLS